MSTDEKRARLRAAIEELLLCLLDMNQATGVIEQAPALEPRKSARTPFGNDAPSMYTIAEAAKYLRVSQRYMYNAIRKEEIPSVRLGRRVLVSKEALAKFVLDASTPARRDR